MFTHCLDSYQFFWNCQNLRSLWNCWALLYSCLCPKFFEENYIFTRFLSGSGACNDRFDYEKWVINWRQTQRFNKEWNLQFISSIVTCCTDKTFQIFFHSRMTIDKNNIFFGKIVVIIGSVFSEVLTKKTWLFPHLFFYSSVFFMANSISMVIIS